MLEFANYTEVTSKAKIIDVEFYGQYEKIFVCPDVNTVWVAKILKGYNENYDRDENVVIIERNNIDSFSAKYLKKFNEETFIEKVLRADSSDGCNWDVMECDNVGEAIDALKDGFRIYLEEV